MSYRRNRVHLGVRLTGFGLTQCEIDGQFSRARLDYCLILSALLRLDQGCAPLSFRDPPQNCLQGCTADIAGQAFAQWWASRSGIESSSNPCARTNPEPRCCPSRSLLFYASRLRLRGQRHAQLRLNSSSWSGGGPFSAPPRPSEAPRRGGSSR